MYGRAAGLALDLLRIAHTMRVAQIQYFESRDKVDLIRAKNWERDFDERYRAWLPQLEEVHNEFVALCCQYGPQEGGEEL